MKKLTIRDVAVFAMLGALMFAGKKIMEFLPNVHPLALLTMVYTVAYRRRGIFPVIVYLLLETAFGGFLWTVPYYYIFPLCYVATLLVPAGLSRWKRQICYTVICTFFGIAFGCLYAPWQAIVFMKTFDFERILAWIVAGLPWDFVHGVSNFFCGMLIMPIVRALRIAEGNAMIS